MSKGKADDKSLGRSGSVFTPPSTTRAPASSPTSPRNLKRPRGGSIYGDMPEEVPVHIPLLGTAATVPFMKPASLGLAAGAQLRAEAALIETLVPPDGATYVGPHAAAVIARRSSSPKTR